MATLRSGLSRQKKKKQLERQSTHELQLNTELLDLYHKAQLSFDLQDIFELLWRIYVVLVKPKRKKVASRSKRSREELVEWVTKGAKLLITYRKMRPHKEWHVLLHEYAVEQGGQVGTFLSQERQEGYMLLMEGYLECTNEASVSDPFMKEVTQLAFNIIKYLKSHCMDPFSSLVGLRVNAEVAKRVESAAKGSAEEANVALTEEDIPHTKLELANHIIRWAFIHDPLLLQQKVREVAGEVRGALNLGLGDVVVVKSEDKTIFARYSGTRRDNTVNLFVNVREAETVKATIDNVFPLPPDLKKKVFEDSLLELEKLVQLPTDEYFHEVMLLAESAVRNYLDENGINRKAMQRANDNACSIAELASLKKAQDFLQQALASPPAELISSLQAIIDEKSKKFYSNISADDFFQATYMMRMKQLKQFQIQALVKMNLHRCLGMCDSGLGQLKLQKRELMNGVRKDKIVSWWLDEIDKAVLDFIVELGYDYGAVPENYVEFPPKDFDAVEKNLQLLKEVLDTTVDKHELMALVEDLKKRIYPRIDAFVADAKIVLSDQFGLDPDCENFIAETTAAFEAASGNLDDQVSEWIENMVKDMEYLEEMKKMEDPAYAASCGNFHIVPISGLIISVFCRLENECSTVQELWEPVNYVNEVKQTETCALHLAITGEELEQMKALCLSEPETVNIQDKNGWTPLHCAASSHGPNALEMCEALLAVNGIDVTLQNSDGNTVLHYLVRIRMDGPDLDRLLSVIECVISKGLDVNVANNYGEVPLHHSCFRNSLAVVELLLGADADVNATNQVRESAMFYAVRRDNFTICSVLMAHGIDITIANSDGETAVDLARKYNNGRILDLLEGTERPRSQSRAARVYREEGALHHKLTARSSTVAGKTRYAVQEVRDQWSEINSGDFSKEIASLHSGSDRSSEDLSEEDDMLSPRRKKGWNLNPNKPERRTAIAMGSRRTA